MQSDAGIQQARTILLFRATFLSLVEDMAQLSSFSTTSEMNASRSKSR